MALTLNKFLHWESQGLEELDGNSGLTNVALATEDDNQRALRITANDSGHALLFSEVADAGDDYLLHIRYDTSGVTGGRSIYIRDSSDGDIIQIGISQTTIGIRDANASVIKSFTLSAGHSGHIELYFENLASGDWSAKIYNDSQVLQDSDSGTGQDFSSGSAVNRISFTGNAGSGFTVDIPDVAFWSGATADTDLKGPCGIGMHRSAETTSSPDDGGTALDAGTWDDAQELPLTEANDIQYTGGVSSGAIYTDGAQATNGGGPNGSGMTYGSIIGAKYQWRMKRGGGSATEHYGEYGNSGDGTTSTANLALGTEFAWYFVISEAASVVPTTSEYLSIGMSKNGGGRDQICAEMYAAVLFTYPAASAFPYHLRRIKRDDMRTLVNL